MFFTVWGHLSQLVMRQSKSQEKITDSQTFFYSMGRLLIYGSEIATQLDTHTYDSTKDTRSLNEPYKQ